jgi:hypothetical protein
VPFIRIAAYTVCIAAATDLTAQNNALQRVLDVTAPIGISAAGTSAYFIATHDRTILEYKYKSESLQYERQCELPTFYHPLDITAAQDKNGSPLAFVVAWSTVANRGIIARCEESDTAESDSSTKSPSMKIKIAFTDNKPTSIVYSPGNSSIYYVLSRNAELHQIGLDQKNDRLVGELSALPRSGPIAVSPDAKYLFVADMDQHRIVQFELGDFGRSRVVVNGVGYPSAISYNANTNIIYAGDFSGRQVILAKLQNGISKNLQPIRSSSFKGIEGLAPAPTGGLLIADNGANAVFLCTGLQQ